MRGSLGLITVVCQFRSQGVQWPLREGDTVEIRDNGRSVGELPAHLVIELIAHHFHGLELTQKLRDYAQPDYQRMPPRRIVPIAVQEARRERRRRKSA